MPSPILDSLHGGSILEGAPANRPGAQGHSSVLRSIDSILKALAGPHTQVAEDIASGGQPTAPQSIFEAMQYLPTPIGGTRVSGAQLSQRQARTLNELTDWLNQGDFRYSIRPGSSIGKTRSNTAYVNISHPYTNETAVVRVPSDGHIGFVDNNPMSQYKEINRPGNFYDTGNVVTNTSRPTQPQYIGNTSGESYSSFPVLRDALRHRFSKDPTGQWLVPSGREPYYGHRLSPIPLTKIPINWGRSGIRETPPPRLQEKPPVGKIRLPPRQLELLLKR